MAKTAEAYHVPVLIKDSIDALDVLKDGIYVDATFGGGGHSREILYRLGSKGHLYGFDQDEDAEKNIPQDNRFTFVRSNFRYLKNWMRFFEVKQVDGIIADLGVSSHHLDEDNRGFSFRYDSLLDMRMNYRSGKNARDILNKYNEEELAKILYFYGEIKNARKIASSIVKAREVKSINTTNDLLEIVNPLLGKERSKKQTAKLFQALRIEVNDEIEALKELLLASIEIIKPKGKLAIISYHSLEDRIVKNVMKTGNPQGKIEQDFYGRVLSPFTLINNKVIVPKEDEIKNNPRSRSAKLRIAIKNGRY